MQTFVVFELDDGRSDWIAESPNLSDMIDTARETAANNKTRTIVVPVLAAFGEVE